MREGKGEKKQERTQRMESEIKQNDEAGKGPKKMREKKEEEI